MLAGQTDKFDRKIDTGDALRGKIPGRLRGIKPDRLIADSYLPSPIRSWAEEAGIEIVEPVFSPASVLRIAMDQPGIDPADLLPIYSREPEAVRQWRLRKSGN